MLESAIYRPSPPDGQGLGLAQSLANGQYEVYLWIIENHQDNYRDIDVKVEGQLVATQIGEMAKGYWQKYGPYAATVADGGLAVDILRHTKGDPHAEGLAIFRLGGDTDGDGISDADEVNVHHTDPNASDTDGDGIADGSEIARGLDPSDPDQDGNSVLDGQDDWDGDGTDNATELAQGDSPGPVPGDETDDGSDGFSCAASARGAHAPGLACALVLMIVARLCARTSMRRGEA